MVGFVRPPEVRPTVGRLRPQRLVLRQLHPWYSRVLLTVAHAQMPRRDPPRTGEHRAPSHLSQLDNLLVPGHQPPPLTVRVLAPAVKLAPIGRDSQLDKRPRRHARSLSNRCSTYKLQAADGSDTQAGQAWPSTGQLLTISHACHGEGTVAAAVETEVAPTGHCHELTTRFHAVRGRTVEMNRSRLSARIP